MNIQNIIPHQSKTTIATQDKVKEMLLDVATATHGTGTHFFRSDTGTGKSTGFVMALPELVELGARVCIAVPTNQDAEAIYQMALEVLEDAGVGVWTSGHQAGDTAGTLKLKLHESREGASDKQVFIGTHANLLSKNSDPRKQVGERDILIVDEIPNTMEINSLGVTAFAEARAIANEKGLRFADHYVRTDGWIRQRQEEAETNKEAGFKKLRFASDADLYSALEEARSQPPKLAGPLCSVINYLIALRDNRGFERVQRTPFGHRLWFAWFSEVSNWFDRRVIFSATSHLDGFQHSPYASRLRASEGSTVSYDKLKIKQVPWANIPKSTEQVLRDPDHTQTALSQIKHIIADKTSSDEVLVVMPKALIKWFAKDVLPAIKDKQVHYTNYGRDIGSNEYRNCGSVILWSNFHKPKHVTFSEYLIYSEQEVGDDNLQHVNGGRVSGPVLDIKDSQLYAQIKQMGCRGNARNVDDHGVCGDMELFICWDELDAGKLQTIYPNSAFSIVTDMDPRFQGRRQKGVLPRTLNVLARTHGKTSELTLSQMAGSLGVKTLSKKVKAFKDGQSTLRALGWEFIAGSRGRYSKEGCFRRC